MVARSEEVVHSGCDLVAEMVEAGVERMGRWVADFCFYGRVDGR